MNAIFAWDERFKWNRCLWSYENHHTNFNSLFSYSVSCARITHSKHKTCCWAVWMSQSARSQIRGWLSHNAWARVYQNSARYIPNRAEAHLNFSFPHFLRHYVCCVCVSFFFFFVSSSSFSYIFRTFPLMAWFCTVSVCLSCVYAWMWSQYSFSHFMCVSVPHGAAWKPNLSSIILSACVCLYRKTKNFEC